VSTILAPSTQKWLTFEFYEIVKAWPRTQQFSTKILQTTDINIIAKDMRLFEITIGENLQVVVVSMNKSWQFFRQQGSVCARAR